MRKLWANLMLVTVCKWFGHTQPLWRPLFRPWNVGQVDLPYWLRPRVPEAVYSGQCQRCWRVIDEQKYVELKGRGAL